LFASLFVGIASGLAFEATLKQKVRDWSINRSSRTLAQMQGSALVLPFIGMAIGICVFLASGLEVFTFPVWLAYSISLSLTIFTAVLVWAQLSKVLMQLERGGSKALDLDDWR
jgi:cobalamin biosynthesis protein CobD/CbiB